MTFSPASSPFNSELNDVLLRYLDQIDVTYGIPEGSNVTPTGKVAQCQNESMPLINTDNGKIPSKQAYMNNGPSVSGHQETPEATNLATIGTYLSMGSFKVKDLG